ncbi:hypothetical protein BGX26_002421 [Mortierella sp. AD094]|nr:hypothetical protein BGX26_002421 [Mortierella sp. AD094]
MPTGSNIGVIDENTLLEIKQEPHLERATPTNFGGIDTIVQDICKNIGLRLFPLSLAQALSDRDIMESSQARELSHIRTVFDMALQTAPSAIVLQDLDTIAKDRGIDALLLSSAVSIICDELNRVRQSDNVFVFAISRDRAKLPEIFQKQNIFQHEFQVPIPLKAQRLEMLEALAASLKIPDAKVNSTLNSSVTRLVQMTSGYVAKDLRNICRSSLLHSLRQDRQTGGVVKSELKGTDNFQEYAPEIRISQDLCKGLGFPNWENFSYAIGLSKPSQQIEFESNVRASGQNMFGGYTSLKKRVYQAIHWPLTNPDTFKRMGVKPPMGLLLYGPSASESNMNFIPIKGPEIFSKYLGETEATLRRLFAMARQIAPCILFFDEMDSIGAKRGWGGDAASQGSNGVNERVLSTLLNEMDGVEERTSVFVIGCTNQPQAIDDALLRPGRLDQLIYVGYPTLQDRIDIISTIGNQIPLPTGSEAIAMLANMTVGFSPADISSLFREAAVLTLRRDISSKVVEMSDIVKVIQEMKPSIQSRIAKDDTRNLNGNDVVMPDQYRCFQQER